MSRKTRGTSVSDTIESRFKIHHSNWAKNTRGGKIHVERAKNSVPKPKTSGVRVTTEGEEGARDERRGGGVTLGRKRAAIPSEDAI